MNEEIKQKILDWILESHDHHGDFIEVSLPVRVKVDGKWVEAGSFSVDTKPWCWDGDKPYVNSLELEEFIKSL